MLRSLLDILFPRRCPICDRLLLPAEEGLCLQCLLQLPRVGGGQPGNSAEHRMFGRIPFEHGASYCYYSSEGMLAHVIPQAKYHSKPWLNAEFTQLFVRELRQEGSLWPYDVDCIIPIPTHWYRFLKRGYNQSMAIAEALSREWNLPVVYDCLYKQHYTTSQVGFHREERLHHVQGSFAVLHPERLQGRHLLLVDDVLTTGSTLVAAYDALHEAVPDFRISFLTLTLTND